MPRKWTNFALWTNRINRLQKLKKWRSNYYNNHKTQLLQKSREYKKRTGYEKTEKYKRWKRLYMKSEKVKSVVRIQEKNYSKKLREILLFTLGNKCQCQGINCFHSKECNITDKDILQFDHINGFGTVDRLGNTTCYYLRLLYDIEDTINRIQILCVNCNTKKRIVRNENRLLKTVEVV